MIVPAPPPTPPTVLLDEPAAMKTPLPVFGAAAVPAASVPRKLPSMTLLPPVCSRMALPAKRLMMRARTRLLEPVITRPADGPALVPFSSMRGAPLKPGCVVPSIVTGLMRGGSVEPGLIVCTPVPGILKPIKSAPGLTLASMMACRNEPAPLSLVLVTTSEHCRNKTDTLFEPSLAVARSCLLLPSKSPTATETGPVSTAKLRAALNPPAPSPNKTDTLFEPLLVTARSCLPSPLKSPTTTEVGPLPTLKLVAAPKPPAPLPSKIETLAAPVLATARSCLPSPLKSPTATARG